MQFRQSSPVTALSFFSNMSKAPILVSAGQNGHMCLWDIKVRIVPISLILQEKQLRYESEDAHEGSIHSAIFLPNLYQILTAGTDNSLKIWAMDEIDYIPRLLKSREGHTNASSCIQFYGCNSVIARDDNTDGLGMNILSAGLDRAFRSFHIIREQHAMELSQSFYANKVKTSRVIEHEKRLPVIISKY